MIVRRIAHRIGTDRDVAAYCPGDEAGMERLADGRRAPAAG